MGAFGSRADPNQVGGAKRQGLRKRERLAALLHEKYSCFGPTLATAKLAEDERKRGLARDTFTFTTILLLAVHQEQQAQLRMLGPAGFAGARASSRSPVAARGRRISASNILTPGMRSITRNNFSKETSPKGRR